jgi:hypothetical protein
MLAMRVLHFDYRVVGCVAAWEAILFYFILFYLRLSPLLCISFSLNLFLSPSLSSPSGKRFCRCVCVWVGVTHVWNVSACNNQKDNVNCVLKRIIIQQQQLCVCFWTWGEGEWKSLSQFAILAFHRKWQSCVSALHVESLYKSLLHPCIVF